MRQCENRLHHKAVGIVEAVIRGETPSESALNYTKIDDAKVANKSN